MKPEEVQMSYPGGSDDDDGGAGTPATGGEAYPYAPDLDLITSLERSQVPSRFWIVRLLLGSPKPEDDPAEAVAGDTPAR